MKRAISLRQHLLMPCNCFVAIIPTTLVHDNKELTSIYFFHLVLIVIARYMCTCIKIFYAKGKTVCVYLNGELLSVTILK